jgi:hypothetical protein
VNAQETQQADNEPMISKGDIVSLVLDPSWARITEANLLLGEPVRDMIGGPQFIVVVSNIDEKHGLWVERTRGRENNRGLQSKILVPWHVVITIIKHAVSEAEPEKQESVE